MVRSPAPGRLASRVVEMGAHLGTSSLGAGDQNPQDIRPQWLVADPELRPFRDISSILSGRKRQPGEDAGAGGHGAPGLDWCSLRLWPRLPGSPAS